MKQSRLLPALLLALLMLLPAGCGAQTTGTPQQTPAPTETATVSGAAGTLRVQVPDGWKYELCPAGTLDGSETDFGVKIWPDSGSDSCVQLYWSDSFGVCGTGLKEESLTLAGDSVSAGYYDGDKNWTFLSYQGKKQRHHCLGRPERRLVRGQGRPAAGRARHGRVGTGSIT